MASRPSAPATGRERPHGFLDPPITPPAEPRLLIDPAWSPARLSRAIITAALPWVLPGAVLLVIFNLASMALPVVIGGLVDDVVAPAASGDAAFADLSTTLAWWIAALIGLYVTMSLGYRFGGRLGWWGVQQSQFELSQQILSRILDERGMDGAPRAPGELLSIATRDVHQACLVLYVTVYPPGEIVGLLAAGGILVVINPWLGLGVIVCLPIVLALMHLAARPLRRRALAEQASLADAAAAAADLVAGYRVIRGLHAQREAANRYRTVSRSTLRATLSVNSARAVFDGLSATTSQVFATLVAVTAALMSFHGVISAGELVTIAGVAVTLVGPVDSLVGTLGSFWAVSQAGAQRTLELLRTEYHPAGLGTAELEATADLTFDRLDVPGGLQLTGEVHAGEFVVIEAPQAAHQPLTDLLSGRALASANSQIHLSGQPIRHWRPSQVRERLLVVPHVAGMFAGTVLDNVRATGSTPLTIEAARRALATACLAEAELPQGYDTEVGDGGWDLSGGQRQRIALARAVAADPEFLVLIEPTTSIDVVTEQRIAEAVREHRSGRATIIISGTTAFHPVADRIVRSEHV